MRVQAGSSLPLLAGMLLATTLAWGDGPIRDAPPLPKDPKRWVGAPASWESLRGRVVILDVWTFG